MVIRRLATGALCLALLSAVAGCTAVELREDLCGDSLDNDVDGFTDAADSDCSGGGGESTMAACRNNLDDDMDGLFDCEDDNCASGGQCNGFAMADCSVLTDGTPNGCPRGMFCYPTDSGGECRRGGSRRERQMCRLRGYGPAEPYDCAPDYRCLTYDASAGDQGICTPFCNESHATCEMYSFCNGEPGMLGFCIATCDPRPGIASGCPTDGWRCVSFHELGALSASFDEGSALFQCANASFGVRGTAALGAPCADPATTAPLNMVCASGTMCVPDDGGVTTCRTICNATAASGCSGGQTCRRFYDGPGGTDGNDLNPVGYLTTEFGYCG